MAFNRLVDAEIDGKNPRTKIRHIPAGLLTRTFCIGFTIAASALFLFAAWELNTLCFRLAPVALGVVFLYSFTKRSQRRIRDLLLDQQVVAGIGNIYANEILGRVGVRPTTRSARLSREKVARIAFMIPTVLREAIRWCGTSFSDYRDADDRYGEFQNHLRVYDRDGDTCRVCSTTIKRVALGNRSAFYCPSCQK